MGHNGSVNYHPPLHPWHLSVICYLVSPGGGEFVRKPLPRGGAFFHFSGNSIVPFSIVRSKYACLDNYWYFYKEYFTSGFHSITSLPHSIFLHPSKRLLPAIFISLHMEEKQSIDASFEELKGKTHSL